jgi:hypothetical protein
MGIYSIFHVTVDANCDQTPFPSTLVEEKWIGAEVNRTILKLFLVSVPAETLVCVSGIDGSHPKHSMNDFITDWFIKKKTPMSTDHRDDRDDFS